ncbi:MAG: glycosyl hydrolase [Lewinellaceae bacterium]|nr:glycosyl hydrolase [Lewinella sp.]MCB9278484.1 glycosyl hydrolase [Lewinellaceae bacterium]
MTRFAFALTLAMSALSLLAKQPAQLPFTPAAERVNSFEQRKALEAASIVNGVEFRSVGPSVQSGRVVDLEAWEKDPTHFYVAYASGGLWKTEDNGISFSPIFDKEMVMSIGDIAVNWDRNIIWVGSGEVNSSRSSYAGAGVFKSTNGGKTWQYLGLAETHHIGKIILHPTDPNTVWVAALGHLYSANPERGVYKTADGGKTWKKVLYVNDNAGAVDMVIDPDNPKILYAATWERTRRAWDFTEAGPGSGIYMSKDGGDHWDLISTAAKGFPAGEGAGRIGLALSKDKKGNKKLFACIDNNFRRPKEETGGDELTKDALRAMSAGDFDKIPNYQLEDYLRSNGFPRKYDPAKVKQMIKKGEIQPKTLVEYTENANALLFDTPVIGLEVYSTDPNAKKWTKTHEDYLDGVVFSYGYYFSVLRVAAYDSNKLYTMGVPILRSDDGGKTWKSINGDNVHSDHHALWVDPNRPGHLILGNDGGVNISYDDGEHWIACNTPPVGQFYAIAVDMAKPYNVYGGLQDNGVWMGPSNYRASTSWQTDGQYPYKAILGGDGMQVAVDTRDNETVYTGSQFGNYVRLNTRTGDRKFITPRHDLGEEPYRWNWQTPIWLSGHNQDILYMGSNKLHRSLDQGENFEIISGDLTKGGVKGDVPYGTLTTIHESHLRFGLIYTGSDDGLIHVTQDGGFSWENVSAGLPQDLYVSRVQASGHKEGRVYAALNGYRWDDFSAYLYASEDYGKTWQKIGADLPLEPVNVVKEDPENEDILYVGTDHGLYVSLNRGKSFMLMNNGLPAVAIHDLVVHPREKDLIAGTHGRSLFIGSVKELELLTPALLEENLHLFAMEKARTSSRWGSKSFFGENNPETKIPVYSKSKGMMTIRIQTADGLELYKGDRDAVTGLNYVSYDYSIDEKILSEYNKTLNKDKKPDDRPIKVEKADNGKVYLFKGTYKLLVEKDGETKEGKLVLE